LAASTTTRWVRVSINVTVNFGISGSAPGPRGMRCLLRSQAPGWGLAGNRPALFRVFAFLERGVGDLAQLAGVMGQGADMTPAYLVRVYVEMIAAKGGEPIKHCVDFALGGNECVDGLGVVSGTAVGHGYFLSIWRRWLHRVSSQRRSKADLDQQNNKRYHRFDCIGDGNERHERARIFQSFLYVARGGSKRQTQR
jgi:hypothetical protein